MASLTLSVQHAGTLRAPLRSGAPDRLRRAVATPYAPPDVKKLDIANRESGPLFNKHWYTNAVLAITSSLFFMKQSSQQLRFFLRNDHHFVLFGFKKNLIVFTLLNKLGYLPILFSKLTVFFLQL